MGQKLIIELIILSKIKGSNIQKKNWPARRFSRISCWNGSEAHIMRNAERSEGVVVVTYVGGGCRRVVHSLPSFRSANDASSAGCQVQGA